MKRINKRWLHDHINDPFVKKANTEGYRSRAAYKVIEIDKKYSIFRKGQVVVDLGAAPGAWSQVAKARIGSKGKVIAVDMLKMEHLAGVEFVQGDFQRQETIEELIKLLDGKPLDLVICDMSPNITGVATVDQARATALGEDVLKFCKECLSPQGTLLIKLFQGENFGTFVGFAKKTFKKIILKKPYASRQKSKEIYLLCRELIS